jgi:hypothetical protein
MVCLVLHHAAGIGAPAADRTLFLTPMAARGGRACWHPAMVPWGACIGVPVGIAARRHGRESRTGG